MTKEATYQDIREAVAKSMYEFIYKGEHDVAWDDLPETNDIPEFRTIQAQFYEGADQILSLQEGNLKVGVYEERYPPFSKYDDNCADPYESSQIDMLKVNYRKIREE